MTQENDTAPTSEREESTPPAAQAPAPASEPEGAEAVAFPDELAVLATGASVLYPSIVVPYVSGEERDVRAVDEATSLPNRIVGIFAQQPSGDGEYHGELQPFGTAAAILRMARGQQGGVQAILQGVARVRLVEVLQRDPYWRVRVERIVETVELTPELEALTRGVVTMFQRIVAMSDSLPGELGPAVSGITNPGNLADFIAANMGFKPEERLAVLAATDVTERLRLVNTYLSREMEVAEVGQKIRSQVQGEMDKRQREFILREQLAQIQKELGEEEKPELAELRRRLDEANLPPQARREADRELARLVMINQASPEYQVARTYLEWLADLPWDKQTEEHLDIVEAERILNEDHYGLEKVKQRILDYLAVRKLRRDTRGPILCFVGPPGVGKTSLGQSIARATGRAFVRLALGGMRDEAEIRGHRRTYVGAMPGRIIQELRRAAVNNPLVMLDEVDKLGADYRGDPASALLEVLDPAQNSTFQDHYLDIPFDLSKVLFITTANQLDPIPGPLRDRMEIIDLPGYTEREKLEIAKRYLVPRQIRENGLAEGQVEMPDDTILALIRGYTREAGVRNLERAIGSVCRRLARRVATAEGAGSGERGAGESDEPTGSTLVESDQTPVASEAAGEGAAEVEPTRSPLPAPRSPSFVVRPDELPDLLGAQPLPDEVLGNQDEVGVATGMAATSVGGDVLLIEAAVVPGKGQFSLTGKLGDVMQESARAALTYTRRRAEDFGIEPKFFEKNDIHVHVPAGAIPKDGPSAGVTMATAIVSAVTRRPVRKNVSMTGEISLRGRVLPVGGIKEKVLAAHRAGIRDIIIPKDNARDLDDVPEDLRDEIHFTLAEHVDDVLNRALIPTTAPRRDRIRPELKRAGQGSTPGPRAASGRRQAAAAGGRDGAGAAGTSEPPARRRPPRPAVSER
ncbi:MAG: endopeptidase La [Chloroflexi bacterium]|nr:endopeptidase La [Chloroflexota bacterium]